MPVEKLLTTTRVAELLGVPTSTVARWRHTDYGPPSIRVGKHRRYRAADVYQWIAEQGRTTPSDAESANGPVAAEPLAELLADESRDYGPS
jgi:excisionase family DNA binding protein